MYVLNEVNFSILHSDRHESQAYDNPLPTPNQACFFCLFRLS